MEQGLMVFPSTEEDNKKIEQFLVDYGFHAEYQDEFKCWLFDESEDNYDGLEMELDKYFGKLGINARFEGIFESNKFENLKFKTFEHYLRIVENESNKLRNVTVKFDNGNIINTDMAAHLSDDDINNYYKIGKEFNVGSNGKDKMSKVFDVIINENESTDVLNNFGGIIQPESEWSTQEDSTLLDRSKEPITYQLVKVGDKLFKTNHLDLIKANIGKKIRFKYDSTENNPTMIQPKLMGQIVGQNNETLNIDELEEKDFNLMSRDELESIIKFEKDWLLKNNLNNNSQNNKINRREAFDRIKVAQKLLDYKFYNETLNIDELLTKFPKEVKDEDEDYEQIYNIALITRANVYYTDDSDGIIMYDYDMNLILNGGYLTEESLIKDITDNNYIWASDDMQYNIEEIKKEHNIE